MLIDDFEQRLVLEVASMDATHREFVDLVNRLDSAGKADFIVLFDQLVSHTRAHFESENALMRDSAFPAIREHMGEHQRVMGELERINARVQAGSIQIGRALVREQLPGWFRLHAITMDSALAAHLKARAEYGQYTPIQVH